MSEIKTVAIQEPNGLVFVKNDAGYTGNQCNLGLISARTSFCPVCTTLWKQTPTLLRLLHIKVFESADLPTLIQEGLVESQLAALRTVENNGNVLIGYESSLTDKVTLALRARLGYYGIRPAGTPLNEWALLAQAIRRLFS